MSTRDTTSPDNRDREHSGWRKWVIEENASLWTHRIDFYSYSYLGHDQVKPDCMSTTVEFSKREKSTVLKLHSTSHTVLRDVLLSLYKLLQWSGHFYQVSRDSLCNCCTTTKNHNCNKYQVHIRQSHTAWQKRSLIADSGYLIAGFGVIYSRNLNGLIMLEEHVVQPIWEVRKIPYSIQCGLKLLCYSFSFPTYTAKTFK